MLKLSPRILFLILTFALLSESLSGTKLKCSYASTGLSYSSGSYYCNVAYNAMYENSRVTIDGIEGSHQSGRTQDNVDQIYFPSASKLTYFPHNIESFFKNLIAIYVENTNLLKISQNDLRPFPKLKEIYLYGTKITTIDEELFKFNPELKVIILSYNQISHIDPNVFDGLNKLERLHLSGNKCKSQLSNVFTRSEVLNYIQRIKNGDCIATEILQKKKEAEDQIIKNITTLQAANEECSTKNTQMKINLTSLTNEKSTLAKDLNDLRVQHEKLQSKQVESEKLIEQVRGEHLLCEKSKNDSISELHSQYDEQTVKLQAKYEEVKKMNDDKDEKLKNLEKSNSELNAKIQSMFDRILSNEDAKSKLSDKILNLVDELSEIRAKYESLLKTKLEQSEKLNEKLIEKIPAANDEKNQPEDTERKDSNGGDCLTLFFGPHQRPVILTN